MQGDRIIIPNLKNYGRQKDTYKDETILKKTETETMNKNEYIKIILDTFSDESKFKYPLSALVSCD